MGRIAKFDRNWLKKASEVEEQRYLLATQLVKMGLEDSSLNFHKKIDRINSLPSVLLFKDWFELTYGSVDADDLHEELWFLRTWLRSDEVGDRKSLSEIGGELEYPSHLTSPLIGMSMEYEEYLASFKAF